MLRQKETKQCECCGQNFKAYHGGTKYCSKECATIRNKLKKKEAYAIAKIKAAGKHGKSNRMMTISDIEIAARAKGISYGQAVAERAGK